MYVFDVVLEGAGPLPLASPSRWHGWLRHCLSVWLCIMCTLQYTHRAVNSLSAWLV